MDEIDKKIISELIENGRVSYKHLGDVIGYTIMGVKRRVQNMLSKNIIKVSAGINVDSLNLHAALILLELESQEALSKCLERFKECPRALVIAEDRETLESESMEKCSLRCMPGVRRTEFYPIGSIHYSPFLRMRINLATKNMEIAPCNVSCKSCIRYKDKKCVGCPATKYYRGPL